MAKARGTFDTRKFLTITGLFAAVAALMLFTKPDDPAKNRTVNPQGTIPHTILLLKSKNAEGSISVNGVPIAAHKAGREPHHSRLSLTPWLQNGDNTLTITATHPTPQASPKIEAKLERHQPGQAPIVKPLLTVTKPGSISRKITAQNLPLWQWQQGEEGLHSRQDIAKAIKTLHKAYQDKDIKLIRQIERPLFQEMVQLTGREGLERRVYRGEIIEKGRAAPLPAFTIIPYHNGKLIRVTGKDGEAPIRIYYAYGGGGKVILTGKYWSKINGSWQVVR